jgi:hypothetical protein
MLGRYPVLLDVGGDVSIANPPGPIAGSASTGGDIIVVERADRPQDVDLAVAIPSRPRMSLSSAERSASDISP